MASHFKRSYTDERDFETKASPMATDDITKLHSGEGARKFAARPKQRREESKPARAALIGVAAAALLVIAAAFFILRGILGQPVANVDDAESGSNDAPQQVEVSVDAQTGAVEAGTIDYLGETISMEVVEGHAAVMATDEAGNQRTLFVLPGTPTTMLFFNGTLLVPENLSDGWDVMAYVLDGEAQPGPIVEDGEPVHGEGEIVEAYLDGAELVVTDSTGATVRLAL